MCMRFIIHPSNLHTGFVLKFAHGTDLVSLISFKDLEIRKVRLETLPNEISQLQQLTAMRFTNCHLRSIPSKVGCICSELGAPYVPSKVGCICSELGAPYVPSKVGCICS
jgi:hypothetical protein